MVRSVNIRASGANGRSRLAGSRDSRQALLRSGLATLRIWDHLNACTPSSMQYDTRAFSEFHRMILGSRKDPIQYLRLKDATRPGKHVPPRADASTPHPSSHTRHACPPRYAFHSRVMIRSKLRCIHMHCAAKKREWRQQDGPSMSRFVSRGCVRCL